ncbi:MAG: IgGFc-binding protein, partial [Deltaproteobacteria bacterium]|nr:IgGFc-binding protein [Deltaproteobacteria bacterium]
HMNSSGLMAMGTYKIESDIPIIAYQFNPVDGASSYLSDASTLIPVTSLSRTYDVVGWKQNTGDGDMRAYFTVVAVEDGTEVTVSPSVAPLAGGVVPGTGETFTVSMDEGDVLEVETNGYGDSLTGSRITSNEEHPIAVFSGQECGFIPESVYACDHLEEQLPGLLFWGKEFVAARMPVRSASTTTEDVLWQIYASRSETEVTITADSEIVGLPDSPIALEYGEVVEFYVHGTTAQPGDFFIESNYPIAVMQYMIGASNPNCEGTGDPAMLYVGPTEQFLPRYVVLVPGTWVNDALIITRSAGSEVLLDGETVPDAEFVDVASSGFEVARIDVDDGVHTIESENGTDGLAVGVVGWDLWDSYAYFGGMWFAPINPDGY